MMQFEFTKMHGTGNDFILVNNFDNKYKNWSPDFVKSICKRHTGIGADGLLVLERSNEADFNMRFFNSDGYESDMCANGSRCICKFAYDLEIVKNEFIFRANDGLHKAFIINKKMVKVQVNFHGSKSATIPKDKLNLPDGIRYKDFLNTGVPHLILECDNIDQLNVDQLGKYLRYHQVFAPEGTNVNFVEILDENQLKVRTYERGVEEETLSCGSGVTASAITFAQDQGIESQFYDINTTGGDLKVYLLENYKSIYLEGPVTQVYKGKYTLEDIQ